MFWAFIIVVVIDMPVNLVASTWISLIILTCKRVAFSGAIFACIVFAFPFKAYFLKGLAELVFFHAFVIWAYKSKTFLSFVFSRYNSYNQEIPIFWICPFLLTFPGLRLWSRTSTRRLCSGAGAIDHDKRGNENERKDPHIGEHLYNSKKNKRKRYLPDMH